DEWVYEQFERDENGEVITDEENNPVGTEVMNVLLDYKPIFGKSVKFWVTVLEWDDDNSTDYTETTVSQDNETSIDVGGMEDPFGDD
ncbi:MAG: hypothetical protein K2H87_08080, partial [Duncaniella sp.]|nr:hypothetical protein [Duncaniella sp.]